MAEKKKPEKTGDESPRQEKIPGGKPDNLADNIGYLLNTSFRLLKEKLSLSLCQLDLTFQDYVVMRMVEFNHADTQKDIGRLAGIDRTSMVDLIDRLAAKDLLQRQRDEQDRRKQRISLTPRGRKCLSHAKRLAAGVHSDFLSPLAPKEASILKDSLQKLIEAHK